MADESSPFDTWLHNHNGTLEEQVAYAQEIYLRCASTTTQTRDDPQDIVQQLRETPLSDRLASPKGISVDWLLDVFCKQPFVEALMAEGAQLWFLRKVGTNEILRRKGIRTGPLVNHAHRLNGQVCTQSDGPPITRDKATIFISYTGRFRLKHFKELLEELRGQYVWIDVLCVDQFVWTGHQGSEEVRRFSDKLITDLPNQISAVDKVMLLLEQWHDPNYTLQQAWVLWELFNTVQVGKPFSILMPAVEQQKYISSIDNAELDKIQRTIGDIKCENAKSEDSPAREKILAEMRRTGYFDVNCKVAEQVRRWYQHIGYEHLRKLDVTDDLDNRLIFLNNFACLLHAQSQLDQAEAFFREVMEAWLTPNSFINYANVLCDQGHFERAIPFHFKALEVYREQLDDDDPRLLDAINTCAKLLRNLGPTYQDRAESLFLEALEARRGLLGPNHAHTLQSVSDYAYLLLLQARYGEAEKMFKEAVEGRRKVLGDEHPHTLQSLHDYSHILYLQDRFDESEKLCHKALEISRKVLGNYDPRTIQYIRSYAVLLFRRDKLDQAQSLFCEAMERSREALGNNSDHTYHSVMSYGNFLRQQRHFEEAERLLREAWQGFASLGNEDFYASVALKMLQMAQRRQISKATSGDARTQPSAL